MNADLFVSTLDKAIHKAVSAPELAARHADVEDLVRAAYHDAMRVTVGRVVTLLWGIAKKTPDKTDAGRIKNLAGQIASYDME